MNTLRLLLMLAPLSLALGVGYGLLSDRFAGWSERALVESFPELIGSPTEGTIWARAPDEIVRIRRASPDGAVLEGVSIFDLAPDGTILGRTDAEGARHAEGDWMLTGSVTRTGMGARRTTSDARRWSTRLTPGDVVTLAARPEFVGAESASQVLAGIAYGARGASFYETRLWRSYAAALVPAVMMLYAAAAGFGLTRSGGQAWYAVAGIATGFLYIVVDGVLLSLGASGAIDPRLSVFSAPVFFGTLGLWGIVVLEE